MDNTRLWSIFLEKLGGLVKGIGSLLIDTGKALRKVADGRKIDLEEVKQNFSGKGDLKD
jgi:hypothetical protein